MCWHVYCVHVLARVYMHVLVHNRKICLPQRNVPTRPLHTHRLLGHFHLPICNLSGNLPLLHPEKPVQVLVGTLPGLDDCLCHRINSCGSSNHLPVYGGQKQGGPKDFQVCPSNRSHREHGRHSSFCHCSFNLHRTDERHPPQRWLLRNSCVDLNSCFNRLGVCSIGRARSHAHRAHRHRGSSGRCFASLGD